ncbi:MAG: class I SAM-dependent DNA methyltransferase [Candidatus Ozemobacteraceae bacterium]
MLNTLLQSKVDSLWNKFWSGGIANPLTVMEQISYLLFMRRLDAIDCEHADKAEWLEKKHSSVFEGKFKGPDGREWKKKELRWTHFRHLPGEEMLSHVRDRVFPFIKSLGSANEPFARYMQDAVFIIPKASLLVEAVGIIDEIYTDIERERQTTGQTFHDIQGDIYEQLLSEISTAGKNGQFRTPRHIIQMMCALVDPKLGEEICDPACGTGGFLLGAYQHLWTAHTSKEHRKIDDNGLERGLLGDRLTEERQWEVLRKRTFHGFDFDTTMVRIGLMNLMTHGIEGLNIEYKDTLSKKFDERDRYDVVLANPPFKGSIDKGDINQDLTLSTTKTELLFVERIFQLLRIGGRAAVIVPDGVLFGSSNAHQALRKLIIEQCELQGIISMPSGVFKPYAGVSAAVMIFVKGGRTEKIWFYDMAADGYSLDDKRQKIADNDIPDVVKRWKKRNPEKDTDRAGKAFFVPVTEIVGNKFDLSINRYKETKHEEETYEPPEVIISRMKTFEKEIAQDLEGLENALK